ncbi:MAG TPA: hypothetical protein VFE84_02265 [Patescibacteria group bacterium]|nr:hypothetical protein [Patescibacteria group bacterium]
MNENPGGGWACPLCGAMVTEDQAACGACPVSKVTGRAQGCGVLCCPRCGYRFVERSGWLESLSRLWRGKEHS